MLLLLLSMVFKLPLQGIPKRKFTQIKRRYNLQDLVEIHHIIPKQFKNHPVLVDFDIDDGCNLMLLPNTKGKVVLNTSRLNHRVGHVEYNRRIGEELDRIHFDSQERLSDLIRTLRRSNTEACTSSHSPFTFFFVGCQHM